jgi:hypothetical protein
MLELLFVKTFIGFIISFAGWAITETSKTLATKLCIVSIKRVNDTKACKKLLRSLTHRLIIFILISVVVGYFSIQESEFMGGDDIFWGPIFIIIMALNLYMYRKTILNFINENKKSEENEWNLFYDKLKNSEN